MPANWQNSAVATGLGKISFHSNPKQRQCQECSNYHPIALISHTSKVKVKVTEPCLTLYDPSPWNSRGQNTGMGSLSLLHGIFPTQGSNPGILHCRWIVYHLSNQESPFCAYETLNNKNSMVGCAPKLSVFVQEGEK